MTTYLLDANVLIALTVREHEHHDRASAWLARADAGFALCPVVEGALVRFIMRMGERPATASTLLRQVRAHPRCAFLPDDLSYLDVVITGLTGHRQVTDTYLVELAAAHDLRLATLDRALADARPASTCLIP